MTCVSDLLHNKRRGPRITKGWARYVQRKRHFTTLAFWNLKQKYHGGSTPQEVPRCSKFGSSNGSDNPVDVCGRSFWFAFKLCRHVRSQNLPSKLLFCTKDSLSEHFTSQHWQRTHASWKETKRSGCIGAKFVINSRSDFQSKCSPIAQKGDGNMDFFFFRRVLHSDLIWSPAMVNLKQWTSSISVLSHLKKIYISQKNCNQESSRRSKWSVEQAYLHKAKPRKKLPRWWKRPNERTFEGAFRHSEEAIFAGLISFRVEHFGMIAVSVCLEILTPFLVTTQSPTCIYFQKKAKHAREHSARTTKSLQRSFQEP